MQDRNLCIFLQTINVNIKTRHFTQLLKKKKDRKAVWLYPEIKFINMKKRNLMSIFNETRFSISFSVMTSH